MAPICSSPNSRTIDCGRRRGPQAGADRGWISQKGCSLALRCYIEAANDLQPRFDSAPIPGSQFDAPVSITFNLDSGILPRSILCRAFTHKEHADVGGVDAAGVGEWPGHAMGQWFRHRAYPVPRMGRLRGSGTVLERHAQASRRQPGCRFHPPAAHNRRSIPGSRVPVAVDHSGVSPLMERCTRHPLVHVQLGTLTGLKTFVPELAGHVAAETARTSAPRLGH